VWRYIPQLKQPACVIYGAESDTFLAPAVKRFEAVVPQAIFHRFDQTGHFVPMERPQETVEAIFTFLGSQDIS
jgi:pimeloyl-ACP methyl ester carboxylesterase